MSSTMLHYMPNFIGSISSSSFASSSSSNITSPLVSLITPTNPGYPFYHTSARSVFPWISDKNLSLAVPVVFYWAFSLVWHFLDTMKFSYFEEKRIHESPEVLARNKVTMKEVVREVLIQHVLQTALGMAWFGDEKQIYETEVLGVDHMKNLAWYAPKVAKVVLAILGPRTGEVVLRNYGQGIVRWAYWWGAPTLKLIWAFFVLDTWQYFWHRAFHTNKFLYRRIHSIHHRLYVPYAFGALYNHPIEGFILDTLGATVAKEASFMSMRQAILFFGLSELKTVDDHAGYRIWWDPFQFLFLNNADYHDIHHQAYGIKANFSQPYFINWDVLLGTRMTREEANKKVKPIMKGVPITRVDKTE